MHTKERQVAVLIILISLVGAVKCRAQDDTGGASTAKKLVIVGKQDQLVLVGTTGGGLEARPGRASPMSNHEISNDVTLVGVPANPYTSHRTLPPIEFGPIAAKPIAPLAHINTSLAVGSTASGAGAGAHFIDLAPPIWATPVVPPPVAVDAAGGQADDAALSQDVLTPDVTGAVKIQANRDHNIRSPFNPARIIFSDPQRINVLVEAIIIPKSGLGDGYAFVGGKRVKVGDTFHQGTLQVSAVLHDGLIVRTASGVKIFAPVGREIHIVTEQ